MSGPSFPATRIHRLGSLSTPLAKAWLKREDEAGFGISGSKKRKYASLLPYLRQEGIQTVGLIGGARSNHIVGLLQLLRERGFEIRLFLRESHAPARGGNAFLLGLLSRTEEIQWISKTDWPRVENLARTYLDERTDNSYLVPEGGFCTPAIAGAATLLQDIERNEAAHDLSFDHIFVDAGTGFTACVLTLLNELRQRNSQLHIVRTAGT